MAYNVLTGTVQGSVEQHGDQEIEGWKKRHLLDPSGKMM